MGYRELGGREGIRTPGLLVANEALSQLSYSPTSSNAILANVLMLANTRSTAHKQIGRPPRRTPVDPEMRSDSGSYGCSMDPPASWATIFLAFCLSAIACGIASTAFCT